ncbi:MAG: hypothetical protein KIS78_24000 [Labilithrix sp.]|nr:hypothetical protein [Labilithrix sp.]MCW5835487.1 hypothetical protein [Labilithrix sp.]
MASLSVRKVVAAAVALGPAAVSSAADEPVEGATSGGAWPSNAAVEGAAGRPE